MISLIPVSLIVFIDQVSKYLIKSNYLLYQSESILSSYLKFTYIENPGLAFGLSVGGLGWLLFLVTLAITIYILIYLIMYDLFQYERVALVFILGGAIGNLIDRCFTLFGLFGYNGVIDFIDVGIYANSMRWYVFNVADISVTVGITYYLIFSYIHQNSGQIKDEVT